MSIKIKDDEGKQKYAFSFPIVWPDGSEISVYSSEDNRRMLFKHSSGSHIEFKEDGSIIVKAIKDLAIDCGVVSDSVSEGGGQSSSMSVINCDSDLNINVKGALTIEAKTIDMVANESMKVNTSGDLITDANNNIIKCKEQISLESPKSVYVSANEVRENITTRTTEAGSSPSVKMKGLGGNNVTRVHGHHVIENTDPKGGITIKSAGYMNIVTAAERIDVTGDPAAMSPSYDPTPLGKATYTHIVRPYPGPTPRGIPGSSYFECGPGGLTSNIIGPIKINTKGPFKGQYTGTYNEDYIGPKFKNVKGAEIVNIKGIYKVKATQIFLN